MSSRLKDRVLKLTNEIYNQCVSEVFSISEDSDETIDAIRTLMDIAAAERTFSIHGVPLSNEIQDLIGKRDQVSSLYQEKLTTLSSKDLSDIIKAHKKGLIKRTDKTIETILSELARRALLDDTNESDLNNKHGEMDEPTVKSAARSKKAASKRCKTSKNR